MLILNGDLFKTPFEIIAHQVNCQGVMGSGVAKQVKEKFPYVYSTYVKALKQNGADFMYGKSQIFYQKLGKNTPTSLGGEMNCRLY